MRAHLVLSTAPNDRAAARIAETLVRKKLAACVTRITGARSVYRWKGKVERAAEVLLLIKAPKSSYKKIEKEISRVHPYEVPEILALEINAGSKKYRDWLSRSVL